MKEFKMPVMELVSFKEDDIIATSGVCHGYVCGYYSCPECNWGTDNICRGYTID